MYRKSNICSIDRKKDICRVSKIYALTDKKERLIICSMYKKDICRVSKFYTLQIKIILIEEV